MPAKSLEATSRIFFLFLFFLFKIVPHSFARFAQNYCIIVTTPIPSLPTSATLDLVVYALGLNDLPVSKCKAIDDRIVPVLL